MNRCGINEIKNYCRQFRESSIKIWTCAYSSALRGILDTLILELDTVDDEVRARVRDQLVKAGASVVEDLIVAMQTGGLRLSWQAAVVLGQIPDPRWVSPMREALTSSNILLGQAAIIALENALHEGAVDAFLDALPRTKLVVQMTLVAALERLGDPRAVIPLCHYLESTNSPELHYTIIQALGILGDSTLIPLIKKFQNNPNQHVRQRAEIALNRLTK